MQTIVGRPIVADLQYKYGQRLAIAQEDLPEDARSSLLTKNACGVCATRDTQLSMDGKQRYAFVPSILKSRSHDCQQPEHFGRQHDCSWLPPAGKDSGDPIKSGIRALNWDVSPPGNDRILQEPQLPNSKMLRKPVRDAMKSQRRGWVSVRSGQHF